MNYYDDNYGHWDDMDDPDMKDFYFQTQRTNKRKKCEGCGNMGSIQPNYAYCNACATKREHGIDFKHLLWCSETLAPTLRELGSLYV